MKISRAQAAMLAAVGVVSLLSVAPPTRWIVRQQIRLLGDGAFPQLGVVKGIRANPDAAAEARERATVASHPDDLAVQIGAVAENVGDGVPWPEPAEAHGIRGTRARKFLALREHFGDRVDLDAMLLRSLCSRDLVIHRTEEQLMWTSAERKFVGSRKSGSGPVENSPDGPKVARRIALQGEQDDPQNAFFPLMDAVALLSSGRCAEAADAYVRASTLPHWNDYTAETVRAKWAMLAASHDEPGALTRRVDWSVASGSAEDEFARLRTMSRVMVGFAVQRELAGDKAGGLRIRRAVARVGSAIRDGASFISLAQVGTEITRLAALRPGGAPSLDDSVTDTSVVANYGTALTNDAGRHAQDVRASRYLAYLRGIGANEEAAYFIDSLRKGDALRVLRHSPLAADAPENTESYVRLGAWWGSGAALLAGALWSLIFGATCAIYRHVMQRTPQTERVRKMYRISLPLASINMLLALIRFAATGIFCVIQTVALTSAMTDVPNLSPSMLSYRAVCDLFGAATLIAPLLYFVTVLASVRSRSADCDISHRAVDAGRRYSPAIIAVMLTLFSVSVVGTAIGEASARRQLNRVVVSERDYLSSAPTTTEAHLPAH